MTTCGQLCLLAAFVAFGYASFCCLFGTLGRRPLACRRGLAAGWGGMICLTGVVCILGWALAVKDFRFDYVARYSSRLLPWQYSLSALWVGQAGSLLLWCWILTVMTLLLRGLRVEGDAAIRRREIAFGLLMGYACFLVAVMAFAADPMRPSLTTPQEGLGLSPLLQHPSMLIHPPVVFTAYAVWAVPCALAAAVLLDKNAVDAGWVQQARPWALAAWTVLGAGILLGADWAYQELGWGGYWGWDPVENGSLVPWLSGTAFIHCMMAWRHRGCLKKTTVALAFVTFGLCNFATFLTRSGIVSSVHAFSQSPIGWMFLLCMLLLGGGGTLLIVRRRGELCPTRRITTLWAREALVVLSTVLLLVLTAVIVVGTVVGPVSDILVGRTVQLGPAFYNGALVPVGLGLLALTAAVPLLRWGSTPSRLQRRVLAVCLAAGLLTSGIVLAAGVRDVRWLAVAGLSAASVCAVPAAWLLESFRRDPAALRRSLFRVLSDNRRQYGGYVVHLGIVCLAVGITGSSLGSQRHEAVLDEGDTLDWAGRQIRCVRLIQRNEPDKLVVEAELEFARAGSEAVVLRPARHLHRLQDEWTSEVAIHSTWGGDLYTILHNGMGGGPVTLTFVHNPLIRWMWFGGCLSGVGALFAAWPTSKRRRGVRAYRDRNNIADPDDADGVPHKKAA